MHQPEDLLGSRRGQPYFHGHRRRRGRQCFGAGLLYLVDRSDPAGRHHHGLSCEPDQSDDGESLVQLEQGGDDLHLHAGFRGGRGVHQLDELLGSGRG